MHKEAAQHRRFSGVGSKSISPLRPRDLRANHNVAFHARLTESSNQWVFASSILPVYSTLTPPDLQVSKYRAQLSRRPEKEQHESTRQRLCTPYAVLSTQDAPSAEPPRRRRAFELRQVYVYPADREAKDVRLGVARPLTCHSEDGSYDGR